MDQLKKATNIMTDFCQQKTVQKDKELAAKKALLGETLPDISLWEDYCLQKENLDQFDANLKALEEASDSEIKQLSTHPGNFCDVNKLSS